MTSGKEIEIQVGKIKIKGILGIPRNPIGFVIFAHGSGSGRLSPRNNFVAEVLNKSGFATLLIDLLTPEEEIDRKNVFDIELLAGRLMASSDWAEKEPRTKNLPIGFFGASTGAAAALRAAAEMGKEAMAVVSRGGRPDLTGDEYLPKVLAPTLLIVGGDDLLVIGMNEEVLSKLKCEKKMTIIPGAAHLFEEPGALEEVARLSEEWFLNYMKKV